MAPSRVTDAFFLVIWRRMEAKRKSVRVVSAKLHIGQHVRISKKKMKFAKAAEHIFSTELFSIVKLIDRIPRAGYELDDLNRTPIDSQEELTPYALTDRQSII